MANYTDKQQPRSVAAIDAELTKIQTAIASHLDRNPEVGQDNQMNAELDMNSNKIINLAPGTANSDAATVQQLNDATASVAISSIDNIDSFLGSTASTALDLEAACDATETLLFGGQSITIDADVTIDGSAVCSTWDLQGATITLTGNAQITIEKDNFKIINGVINGGLQETFLSSPLSVTGNTLTVNDSTGFEVGGHVSCSWTNASLPNTGTLNVITGVTPTTITLTNNATAPIPQNARIFNARFDKTTIKFTGSGLYTVANMVFEDCANAYFVDVTDTTEQARIYFVNCKFNSIALDCFKFQCDTAVFENVHCASPRDIGKQNIVWATNSKRGTLNVRNSTFFNGTRDAFLFGFATGSTMHIPDCYFENSTFDGSPSTNNYTPNREYNYQPTYNFLAFFMPVQVGSASTLNIAQTVEVGKLTAVNCEFKQSQRAIWGTTYDGSTYLNGSTTFNQDKVLFQNCLLDGTPVDIRTVGADTNIESVLIQNSEIRFSGGINTFFLQGVRDYTLDNCVVKDNYPDAGGLSQTIAAAPNDFITGDVFRNQILTNTSTGKNYICVAGASTDYTARVSDSVKLSDTNEFLEIEAEVSNGVWKSTIIENRLDFEGNDIFFEKARFNKVGSSVTNKPQINNFQQGKLSGSIVLLGQDVTDPTSLELTDWFTININPDNKSDNDLPRITIYVDNSNCIIEYGGNETTDVGGEGDYHYRFLGLRSDPSVADTSPLNYRGAFMHNPPERSIVQYSRDRSLKQIVSSKSVAINSGTVSTNTLTTTAIPSGDIPYVGDWISLNESGSNLTYFHEIRAVSGSSGAYTLTVRPALEFTADSADNSQLIKHDWLYGAPQERIEVVRSSGFQALTGGIWNTLTGTTERLNESEYGSTIPASGTVTLPRGKYIFEASAGFQQASGNTSPELKTTIRLLSSGSKFTAQRSATCSDRIEDLTTSTNSSLNTWNHVSGTFELDDEDTVQVQVFPNIAADVLTADANNDTFNLRITKVG